MRKLSDRPGYCEGYKRGLRRLYHHEVFGTEAGHRKWMALVDDPDQARQERGRGYRDGFTGRDPKGPSEEA